MRVGVCVNTEDFCDNFLIQHQYDPKSTFLPSKAPSLCPRESSSAGVVQLLGPAPPVIFAMSFAYLRDFVSAIIV